jgi:hypothetical protein
VGLPDTRTSYTTNTCVSAGHRDSVQCLLPSSSGGKSVLLGMSKRGDAYLRTLLIHGARAVIHRTRQNPDGSTWLHKLIRRRNVNVAAVALANKNARIAWALLARDRLGGIDISHGNKQRQSRTLQPGCAAKRGSSRSLSKQ